MISGMPSEEELGLFCGQFQVFDITSESPTQIYSFIPDCLRSLEDFARNMHLSAIFIERMYIDKSSLKISNDHFKGIKLEILGGVQFDSHRFNRDLENMDLSSPVELRVFTLYEGKAFGVRYVDSELDAIRSVSPEMRVSLFAEERLAKLSEKTVIEARKDDPQIERFCDVLLLDRMYRLQRDDNERMNYVIKVARRPGNENLRKAVYKDDGSGFSTEKVRAVVAMTVKKTDVNRDPMVQSVFKNE